MAGDAPFHADVAGVGSQARARWLLADDGLRLRLAHWPAASGPHSRGCVLIFPGQAEHVEKYGPTAAFLALQGFDVLAIDWRGQGLSDRLGTQLCHIDDFADFQRDVAAMVVFARTEGLPRPFHLLAHSMGGCIGLRALHRGLDVDRAVFSAPMWGIALPKGVTPLAQMLARGARGLGAGRWLPPGTAANSYLLQTAFAENRLTRDPETYAWLQSQLKAHPELAVSSPTFGWIDAAFREMTALARLESPALPVRIALGSAERVVCPKAIRRRHARWPGAELDLYQGAEHEVMMERPVHRDRFCNLCARFFGAD